MNSISDEQLRNAFPDTIITHDDKEFYRGWLERRLVFNQCDHCGHWHQPPRPICPECWSFDVTPTEVSGRGTVFLFVRLHQGPPAPGVDYSQPHPVVTVELAEQEGLRYTSTIVNCDPQDIEIGMPVQLSWIDRYDVPFPVFEPAHDT